MNTMTRVVREDASPRKRPDDVPVNGEAKLIIPISDPVETKKSGPENPARFSYCLTAGLRSDVGSRVRMIGRVFEVARGRRGAKRANQDTTGRADLGGRIFFSRRAAVAE